MSRIVYNRTFFIALAFFIGIVTEITLKMKPSWLLLFIGITVILSLINLNKSIFIVFVLLLILSIGAFFVDIHRVANITGRVRLVGIAAYTSRRTIVLKNVRAFIDDKWSTLYGKCRIFLGKRINMRINMGDLVYVDGSATPSGFPGDMCAIKISEPSQIGNLSPNWSILGTLLSRIDELRDYLTSEFKRTIPRYSFLASSILLGDRRDIPDNVYSVIKRSGFMHVFAISGMHVMIFAGLLFVTLSWLRVPRNMKYLISILSIIFFICLTGFSIPTVRAGVMAIMILFIRLLDRSAKTINVIGIVAIIFMLIDPYIVFEPSFQLTFIGTIALVLLFPIFYDTISRFIHNRFISGYLAAILAINAGMIPIISYHFGVIYLASIPWNAIFIPPLLSVLLEVGFVLMFLLLTHVPFLSIIFGYSMDALLNVFYLITVFVTSLPNDIIHIRMNIWAIMGFYIALLTLVLMYPFHHKIMR